MRGGREGPGPGDQPGDAAELGPQRAADRAGRLAPAGFKPVQVSSDWVLEEENNQLRARIRELETEREILRRAAKYFAGETNR
ncbi:hypothetical protein GCM10010251_85350 [Streptomyces aurantiogriseus]|uniref:Transposase n=1 Tax=Streptomyces aurantiogriseus TaxID=66870 RepID=A0A918FMD2_9ACTN|nr:hypothetical protein GCM10010251_85350 [Streptomyces aurantiogriseus]